MSEKATGEEAVRYWWKMALESLESARREAEAESLPFAINRLYYAAFYAVSAALLERNIVFQRHSAVRSALHKELIHNGQLEKSGGASTSISSKIGRVAIISLLLLSYQPTSKKRSYKPKASSKPSARSSVPCHNPYPRPSAQSASSAFHSQSESLPCKSPSPSTEPSTT